MEVTRDERIDSTVPEINDFELASNFSTRAERKLSYARVHTVFKGN